MIDSISKSGGAEWLRLTILGNFEIALAWKLRGGGFANTVSEDGWRGFEKHLAAGRDALSKAWTLMPTRPQAAALMIKVAMGGHAKPGETPRLWFDRAVAAQCDYSDAYNSLIYALTPRWGGSNAEMLAFAVACQKAERYDTAIPLRFIQCISSVAEEMPDWRIVYRQPEISRMVVETLDRVASGDVQAANLDHGDIAYYVWMAGDMKRAAQFLRRHGSDRFSRRIASAAIQFGVDTRQVFAELLPYSMPSEKQFHEVNAAIDEKDWKKAEDIAVKLASDTENAKLLSIQALPTFVRFERDFSGGKWAKLPATYPHWSRLQGVAVLSEPERIKFTTEDDSAAFAVFHGALGDRFEVRGKMRFPQGKKQAFQILIGHPTRFRVPESGTQWFQFALETADGKTSSVRIGRSTNFLKNPESPGPAIEQEVNFRVRRDKTKVGFWINDTPVVEDVEIPDLPSGEGSFGVGGRTYGGKEPVQFTELEARRIGETT